MLLLVTTAIAQDCGSPGLPTWLDGDADTSPTASVFVRYEVSTAEESNFDLRDMTPDEPVPIDYTVTPLENGDWVLLQLTPDAALTVGNEYGVFTDDEWQASFFVQEDADINRPKGGAPVDVSGSKKLVNFQLAPVDDDDPVIFEVELSDETGKAVTQYTMTNLGSFNADDCFPTVGNIPGGKDLFVRSRAIDLSGNEGEWSELVEQSTLGCGCSASPGPSLGWLLLLPLLVRRR